MGLLDEDFSEYLDSIVDSFHRIADAAQRSAKCAEETLALNKGAATMAKEQFGWMQADREMMTNKMNRMVAEGLEMLDNNHVPVYDSTS